MDLAQLGLALWRRKAMLVTVFILVMIVAFGSLSLQKKQYKATSTVALVPVAQEDAIFILSQVSTIAPLYAEAITSASTLTQAQERMRGESLGKITVRSFDTPVLKVDATARSPRRAQRSAQAVTDVLLVRSNQGEIGIPQMNLVSLDTPHLPEKPSSPQPKLTLAFGMLLGLGAGVGAALGLDALRQRIEDADTLARVTGAPVYGEVPDSRAILGMDSAKYLLDHAGLRVVAEAFRDLRTNIQFSEGGARSVLVTSPEGRHGKTTVSFGLAVMFARTGARTLLVDGDLRRGRMAPMLGIPTSPGLADVLEGTPVSSVVQEGGFPSLSVMPSGVLVDDPGESLEVNFFSVLHQLERDFDVVVIDGTPLVPINDARVMAKYTGVTLMVVSAGSLTRRQLRTALERLSIISVPLTATVLNNSKTAKRSSYHRYLEPIAGRQSEAPVASTHVIRSETQLPLESELAGPDHRAQEPR
jgi:polysaccharide biosynthesis transport protein